MKKNRKILSLCLGLVLALGVTACDEISDLLDEGVGDGDTTETDTSGDASGGDTGNGGEQGKEKEEDKVLVTSLTFDALSYSLEVGGSTPYSVSVEPSDATNQDYSISFINESGEEDITIACEEDGYIYGLNVGSVTIVATALDGSGVTGSARVEVTPIPNPVTDISFDHTSTSVYEDGSFTIGPSDSDADIKVIVTPSDADDTSWTLSTSSSEYLSISDPVNGVYTVTASEGSGGYTASIIVTSTATSLTATLTVAILETGTTYVPVTSISVDPTELTLSVGESVVIGSESGEGIDTAVSVEPSEATLPTYTVTIPEDAKEYLESETTDGITTITALTGADNKDFIVTITPDDSEYTGDGATLTLKVSKNPSILTEISVSGTESLTIVTEGELDLSSLTVTGTDQYGETMEVESWSLTLDAGETDAELEDTTLKAGYLPGEVTLKVVVDGVDPVEFKVTITQGTIHPTDISISEETFALVEGGSVDLASYVTVTPEGAAESGIIVTPESGSDGVISVSDTVVYAVSAGTATVTIGLKDSVRCSKTLTVTINVSSATIPLESLTLDTYSITLYKGTTQTLVATATPTNATDLEVTWESSDQAIATVDTNGTVSAVSSGSTTITCTAVGGGVTKTATCTVTVNAYVEGITVSTSAVNDSVNSGDTITISAAITNTDATNTAVTWSSDNESVISTSGVNESSFTVTVGAVEEPTDVVVTATASDGSNVTGSVTVHVTPVYSDTLTNYTLSFSYSGYVPSDEQLTIVGDWMDGVSSDNMDLSKSVALSNNSITLASVSNNQTLNFEVLIGYTNSKAPWYTQKVIYSGSVTTAPNDEGIKTSDYSNITVSVSLGVDVSTALASVGENTNYTVALEDTGSVGASWATNGAAFYIEGTEAFYPGDDYQHKDGDGKTTQTMSAYTGNEYDYDFYFEFGSYYGATKLGFAIAPDEWYNDIYNDGLGPVSGFESLLGTDASDGTPFLKYVSFKRESGSWQDGQGVTQYWSTGQWEIDFWQLAVDAGYDSTSETTINNTWDLNPFQFITDMTIVLQLDLSETGFETYKEVDTVSGIYFIVNGNIVGAVSCPAES